MTKPLQVLFVFILVVVSFRFFDAQLLNKSFTNYFVFLYVLCTITISIPYIFPPRIGFIFPIQLIILSMMISIVMANISWEQNLSDSLIATVPLMLWFLFFYLLHIKIPIKTIEKIILIYGVIYIILFFYQLTHNQSVFFGSSDEFREERGVTRISFAGQGIFFLASFIALNKLTTQKQSRWLWMLLSILGLVLPILQATRQYIIVVISIYLFHFIKSQSLIKKVFIIASFFGLLFYFVRHSDIPVVKGLIEAQEETTEEGKEYIRIVSGTYFLTEFSPDNFCRILGNGVPYGGENSDYGKFVGHLNKAGIYMSEQKKNKKQSC